MTPAPQAPPPVVAAPPPAPAPPRVPSAPPKEYRGHRALRDIRFDFDHSSVRPGDAKILDASADWLKSEPAARSLSSRATATTAGTSEYNLALGERRARAAADYLIGKGIAASRPLLVSYGKERPLCEEKTEGVPRRQPAWRLPREGAVAPAICRTWGVAWRAPFRAPRPDER